MKRIIAALSILLYSTSTLIAQIAPPPNNRKVQVAILFDTSNSMDGLIEQAKSRIWNIVNEVGQLTYNGQSPAIEFAVYHYGNDGLDAATDHIELLLDFSSDMDQVSQTLFGLTTNGGSEYCGAVIQKSLDELSWSNSQNDLKMIYIAGNEPFNQGKVNYKTSCSNAIGKDIFINTIYCGNYEQGIREFWKDGADQGEGDYFNIDSDKAIAHIDTPFDEDIRVYNDSLNGTYYGYGSIGHARKEMQVNEDFNAGSQAPAVATERAITKSKKSTYYNGNWDLLDATESGKDILEMEEAELPDEFKGLTDEEKTAKLEEIKEDRNKFQTKISELAVERQNFIDAEMKKRAELGEVDDFGTSVNQSIMNKAKSVGLEKEAPNNE